MAARAGIENCWNVKTCSISGEADHAPSRLFREQKNCCIERKSIAVWSEATERLGKLRSNSPVRSLQIFRQYAGFADRTHEIYVA
jgi:hypothetical protein